MATTTRKIRKAVEEEEDVLRDPQTGIRLPTPRPIDPTESEEDPLLEIDAFAVERPTVRVHEHIGDDGIVCELRLMREFGIADQQRLTRDGQEFEKLWNKDNLTHKEGQRLKLLLDRMFEKVLIADTKVQAKIDDQQRAAVVTAFTYAPYAMAAARERRAQAEEETETIDPSTSET